MTPVPADDTGIKGTPSLIAPVVFCTVSKDGPRGRVDALEATMDDIVELIESLIDQRDHSAR